MPSSARTVIYQPCADCRCRAGEADTLQMLDKDDELITRAGLLGCINVNSYPFVSRILELNFTVFFYYKL